MTAVYIAQARDSRGLDPNVYVVTIIVRRLDGKPLTRAEAAAVAKALEPEALEPADGQAPVS